MVDQVLRDAVSLATETDPLLAETWASSWLGPMWLAGAAESAGEQAEVGLCRLLAARVLERPSAHAVAALHAFARVAPSEAVEELRPVLVEAGAGFSPPPFAASPAPEPVRAWAAVDVWESERLLFVEYAEPYPHTVVAQTLDVEGPGVETLALPLGPGVVDDWVAHRTDDDVPMEPVELPPAQVLADLAEAMAFTDTALPPPSDDEFVDLRALVRSRSRAFLPEPTEPEPESATEFKAAEERDQAQRTQLVDAFLATGRVPDTEVTRSLADTFAMFGMESLRGGPLAWSPIAVLIFVRGAVPERVYLTDSKRAALPTVLRAWLEFALAERGVDQRWAEPVLEAVDEAMTDFDELYDDPDNWGSGRLMMQHLTERGVDLDDWDAVSAALDEITDFGDESPGGPRV